MDDYSSMNISEFPDVPEVPEIPDVPEVPEISDVSEVPEAQEVSEPDHTPEASTVSDGNEMQAETSAQQSDANDITIHPTPGGQEALPNPESEPIEGPHIPEKPITYGGPEGRW